MNYKKAFYSKLEDCYLGVKIKDFHKGNIAKSGLSISSNFITIRVGQKSTTKI
ncbi:hypothetical protein [Helicobacter sp. MIT 14-3879]|uniref:hypothetical protein n=1 Tax=Helicobacter sp. MIT 14-3879 TaxID=2040649 RepID=UPI0015F15110|nr:hypothetical protein [Helicobacter sp. MIT 14-3879]